MPGTMMIPFVKYQALGNSFIVLDEIRSDGRMAEFEKLAVGICDPTYGIGADGLLVISESGGDRRVDIYNADGSWAEKSGNGIRIAAMHLYARGMISAKSVELATGSGVSRVTFHSGDDRRRTVSASLGRPEFKSSAIPVKVGEKYFINQTIKCAGRSYIASAVSVGNPHLVLFCDDFDFDWPAVGALLETDRLFPNRVNVGFVVVGDEENIEVRDWERGVGETQSSGTGAAAAAAISVMRGFTSRRVTVHTQAGKLQVHWDEKSDELIIKGPVEYIGEGRFLT